jgi:hypothetical protein
LRFARLKVNNRACMYYRPGCLITLVARKFENRLLGPTNPFNELQALLSFSLLPL